MATYVEATDFSNGQTNPTVSNGNIDKRDRIPEALAKRHGERLAMLEKRKEQRENEHVKQESADFFSKTFNSEKAAIEERLSTASNGEKSNLIDFFDELAVSAQKLQQYVTDMFPFLPSYDVRSAQENVKRLSNAIQEKRDELMPKKKFTFKARKKGEEKAVKRAKIICSDAVDSGKSVNVTMANACGFSNRTSETLSLLPDEMHAKDVGLSNLSSCVINLPGSPSALHISNLSNCKVFCGPIPGSVFADKCVDSMLVLACQQLRVHNSRDTKFYLHVTSRAIIEDTSTVQFAPYNWTYDQLEQDYEQSGLDKSKNAWNDVDDFNWLAHDEHSPNWGLIPESDRVVEWK